MSQRIVLFGGTFDPIHNGHVIVARAVAEYFHFDRITFVPAYVPPHKRDPGGEGGAGEASAPHRASAEDRLEMIRLAIAGEDLFDVSDIELKRAPPSYTFDTLMQFRTEHGLEARLHWIIGADMLEDLPTWHRAGEVVDMATIITAARPPYSQRLDAMLVKLRAWFTPEQISRLAAGVAPTPLIDITSTQIRHRIRAGRSIRYLTHYTVIDYIHARRLYTPRQAKSC